MNNVGANHFDFQPFRQLEYDYSGYQSLTDVPKASVYTEDIIDVQVMMTIFNQLLLCICRVCYK